MTSSNVVALADRALAPVKSPEDWKPQLPLQLAQLRCFEDGKAPAQADLTPAVKGAAVALAAQWEASLEPATADEIVMTLGKLAAIMAGRQGQADLQAALLAYAEDLEGVPSRVIRAAAIKARRTLKWFPTLAEIRECIAEMYATERPFAIRAYALKWVAENPKQAGWSDEEWWNYRALKAAHKWAQERGLMA